MSEPAAPPAPPTEGTDPKPDCAWCTRAPVIGLAIVAVVAAVVLANIVSGGGLRQVVARWKGEGDSGAAAD